MSENFGTSVAASRQAYQQGDMDSAFKKLRPILARAEDLDENQWQEAFELFAGLGQSFVGPEFAELVQEVAANPNNPYQMVRLGDAMLDTGISDLASAVYIRSNRLDPDQPAVLLRTSNALGQQGRYRLAAELLRQSAKTQATSYDCRYLLAFNALMSGNLDEAGHLQVRLAQEGEGQPLVGAVERLGQMLTRAATVRNVTDLDEHDLRGWHYVITGGLLLHESPHGRDVMNGRYAFFQDSAATQHESLERLAAVLKAWEIRVPRVLALPDRESSALAYAAGQVLGCSVGLWSPQETTGPGLIVAYDLGQLPDEVLEKLYQHRPGQILWNYSSNWTEFAVFAGDLTTYLYEFQNTPWQAGRLEVDPQTKQTVHSLETTGTPQELAARILAAPVPADTLTDLPALIRLAEATRQQAAAFQTSGHRNRQWIGGPVRSNSFNLIS